MDTRVGREYFLIDLRLSLLNCWFPVPTRDFVVEICRRFNSLAQLVFRSYYNKQTKNITFFFVGCIYGLKTVPGSSDQ